MTSCLRASVIDIDISLVGIQGAKIQNAYGSQTAVVDLGKGHQSAAGHGANGGPLAEAPRTPVGGVLQRPSVSEGGGFRFGYGQRRDVVQRGLNRQQMLGSGRIMPCLL